MRDPAPLELEIRPQGANHRVVFLAKTFGPAVLRINIGELVLKDGVWAATGRGKRFGKHRFKGEFQAGMEMALNYLDEAERRERK